MNSMRYWISACFSKSVQHKRLAFALCLSAMLPPAFSAESGERPQIGLQCVASGPGPSLDCVVDLQRKDGSPIDRAQVTLGALMPSMPMAHTIKPVTARPTNQAGKYQGTLLLEMPGVWSIEVDIAAPVREKVVRNLMVETCKGDARCPANPVKPGEKTPEHGSGKGKH